MLGPDKEKYHFASIEIQGADRSRRLQQEIGRPSTTHFKYIVSKQLLINSKIDSYDLNREELVYAPETTLLQVKMTIIQPKGNKIEKYHSHFQYHNITVI